MFPWPLKEVVPIQITNKLNHSVGRTPEQMQYKWWWQYKETRNKDAKLRHNNICLNNAGCQKCIKCRNQKPDFILLQCILKWNTLVYFHWDFILALFTKNWEISRRNCTSLCSTVIMLRKSQGGEGVKSLPFFYEIWQFYNIGIRW